MGSAFFFIVLFCSPICRAAGSTMGLPQFSLVPSSLVNDAHLRRDRD